MVTFGLPLKFWWDNKIQNHFKALSGCREVSLPGNFSAVICERMTVLLLMVDESCWTGRWKDSTWALGSVWFSRRLLRIQKGFIKSIFNNSTRNGKTSTIQWKYFHINIVYIRKICFQKLSISNWPASKTVLHIQFSLEICVFKKNGIWSCKRTII